MAPMGWARAISDVTTKSDWIVNQSVTECVEQRREFHEYAH